MIYFIVLWLTSCANFQDFPPALNALGFYEVNMRQNYSGAAAYFKRAADKGDRDGLTNLAVSYDNGWVEGHPPDKVGMPRV